jgi:ribonuclease J
VLIHTGDFKIDHTPVDGEHFDLQKLAEYGEKGVLCLLSDSTNAEVPGYTPSEAAVYPNLDRIFAQAGGRLMLTTFASSVHRINIALQLAQKHKRKVAVVGRSMLNVIAHCRNLGYIKCPDDIFVSLRAIRNIPAEQLLILTTGSQGELFAAMTRISKGEHPHIKVCPGDTIVFSANPIPGNTIAVVNCIDRLMMQGANVVYGRDKGVHVSGHGCQEDQKLMLALTKPKFFLPVHGEHRMLVQHCKTAQGMGIPAENMIVINNGDIVELSPDSIGIAGQVSSGIELVDQAGVVHEQVMQDRQQLAEDGVITVAATVSGEGTILAAPEIHLRGVVSKIEQSLLQQLVVRSIERIITERWHEFQNSGDENNWEGLRSEIESYLQRLLKRELGSYPLVIFLLQTADREGRSQQPEQLESSKPIPKPQTSAATQVRTYRRRRSTATIAS